MVINILILLQYKNGLMKNKAIIITTPMVYAARLVSALQEKGFSNLVQHSVIENIFVDSPHFHLLFDTLLTYDFIILPSRNAIEAFIEQSKKYTIELELLQQVRFVTIGKDADYLLKFGLTNYLDSTEPSTKGIFNALKKYAKIKKMAVLVPKVEGIDEPDIIPDFLNDLRSIGQVHKIEAYITRPSETIDKQITKRIIDDNYNIIAVTSGGEIEALKSLLGSSVDFQSLRIVCFGPYTAQSAFKHNISPLLVGNDFSSFDGFADAIHTYFANVDNDI